MMTTDFLPRGVYKTPWTGPNGERYVVAVDSAGRRVMEATLFPGLNSEAPVTDLLWRILDREDPIVPTLGVVA